MIAIIEEVVVEVEVEEGEDRRTFGTDSERSKKIANANPQEGGMLRMTEQFRDLFHSGNIRNLEKPKLADGTPMCLRFHALGSCFTDINTRMDTVA